MPHSTHPFTWEVANPHGCIINRKVGNNGEAARAVDGHKIGFCQTCNRIMYFLK